MSPTPLSENTVVAFKKGYRLHFDKIRKQWYIQAPERAYEANEIAVAILEHVDGHRDCKSIIDELCAQFKAPRTRIAHDCLALIDILLRKKILTTQ